MAVFKTASAGHLEKFRSKYVNDIWRLRCFQDILERRLFPNVKEVTESQAGYYAVQEHLLRSLGEMHSDRFVLIAVGDGVTPRTASLFAFRTKWRCISVDPALRTEQDYRVDRLELVPHPIQKVTIEIPYHQHAIIVGIHPHVNVPDILDHIHAHRRSLVMMPCCTPMKATRPADIVYQDVHVHSPKNVVHVWRDI